MRKVRAVIASSCATCQVIDKRMLEDGREWTLLCLVVRGACEATFLSKKATRSCSIPAKPGTADILNLNKVKLP
jgi:hypothetical protein